jgi:hypothetical protein
LAHFCFNLPLVMFQSPLISSFVIIVRDLLFFVLIRRQRDGKSALAIVCHPWHTRPTVPTTRRASGFAPIRLKFFPTRPARPE